VFSSSSPRTTTPCHRWRRRWRRSRIPPVAVQAAARSRVV
jgi:hypothetical protein